MLTQLVVTQAKPLTKYVVSLKTQMCPRQMLTAISPHRLRRVLEMLPKVSLKGYVFSFDSVPYAGWLLTTIWSLRLAKRLQKLQEPLTEQYTILNTPESLATL